MLRIQETKKDLAQAALGEGGAVKLHKLSVKELKAVRYIPYLFICPRISYCLSVQLFGMGRNEDPKQGQLAF